MTQPKTITVADMESILGAPLSPRMCDQVEAANLKYEEISNEERDHFILDVLDVLVSQDRLPVAGEHRLPDWERGWSENLSAFTQDHTAEMLVPRYHGKHGLLHWKQRMIRPLARNFDYLIHCLLVDWAVETYFSQIDAIYEFGCGPAYHLLRARRYNPTARLVGLDWTRASQKIIAQIVKEGIETNIEGRNFNFYEPDYSLVIVPNSGVITIAALEQVGARFEPFLQFLLDKKPSVCIHLEPISELLDPDHLIDKLSILYFQKRNYLNGFLTRLQEMEDRGSVKIHRSQRTYTGSFFIEGHSLIVWSPV